MKEDRMTEEELDAGELLERVKDDNTNLRWVPLPPADGLANWRRWPMMSEESLAYLHRHWVLPDQPDPAVAGGRLKGRLIRLFARLTFRVLGPYLREERELIANMVRTSDALARRCDELTREIERRQTEEATNDARLATWLHETLISAPRDRRAAREDD